MLKNYFKLALKVLGRRKFFTFISLFGISFTLMILMLITSFLEVELGSYKPMSDKHKLIFMPRVIMKKVEVDTLLEVDTSFVDGVAVYDTTSNFQDRQSSWSSSSASYHILNTYLRNVQGAENYSFYANGFSFEVFQNNNKLTLEAIYADERFWQIFDFEFLEGGPFRKQQVDNQEQIVVLTQKARDDYFGEGTSAIGKSVLIDGKQLTVTGVVKKILSSGFGLDAEIYLPYTNIHPSELTEKDFHGAFEGVFLSQQRSGTKLIKDDIDRIAGQIPLPNPEDYNVLDLLPQTFTERYAASLIDSNEPERSYRIALSILIGLLVLFILLPTLNLINLNVSRILERSSEIGVRKAFGAHSSTLLFQFVFENIIITIIGGVLGFFLAFLLLYIINDSGVFPNIELSFNFKVFFYSLLICLLFGLLSGLIPAYRMSKIQIVKALKNNEI